MAISYEEFKAQKSAAQPLPSYEEFKQQRLSQHKPALAQTDSYSSAPPKPTFIEGVGRGMLDIAEGVSDIVGKGDLLNNGDTSAADKAISGNTASNVGRIGGNIAATVPTMFIPGANTAVGAAAIGAGTGLATTKGDIEERLKSAAFGGAGGAAGVGVGKILGSAIKPFSSVDDPIREKMVQQLKDAGIDLNAGQQTGNRSLQQIDKSLSQLPITDAPQAAARLKQTEQFNRAVGKYIGVDSPNLTTDVLHGAKQEISKGFNDVTARNKLAVDQPMLDSIAAIRDSVAKFYPEKQPIVEAYLKHAAERISPDGVMDGKAYRTLYTQLNDRIKSTNDGDLRTVLTSLRDNFSDAMERNISPEDLAKWQDLRSKTAIMHTIADVAKNSPKGDVKPSALLSRINVNSKQARLSNDFPLTSLARAGKEVLRDLPDSGTAANTFWTNAINNPMRAAAGLGISAYTVPMQNALWGGVGNKYLTKGLNVPTPSKNSLGLLGQNLARPNQD